MSDFEIGKPIADIPRGGKRNRWAAVYDAVPPEGWLPVTLPNGERAHDLVNAANSVAKSSNGTRVRTFEVRRSGLVVYLRRRIPTVTA